MRKHVTVGLLGAALLIGCAAPGESPDMQLRLAEMGYRIVADDQRVPSFPITGWQWADDRHLVISAGLNNRYMVSLASNCEGLATAFRVGFTTPGGGSRAEHFEDLVLRSPESGAQRCSIRDIYRLADL